MVIAVNRPRLQFTSKPDVESTIKPAASTAVVVGDVTLGDHSSVWYHAVLRGDINYIKVGAYSNIQDGAVIHLADEYPCEIGDWVTVGHCAVVHACKVGDECLIGMNSTILDGAEIGAQSIVGANALVTQETKIPEGSLVLGSPAKEFCFCLQTQCTLQLHFISVRQQRSSTNGRRPGKDGNNLLRVAGLNEGC